MKKIISNRIEKKFLELKKEKRKALVSFITAGDPNLKTSQKIMNLLSVRLKTNIKKTNKTKIKKVRFNLPSVKKISLSRKSVKPGRKSSYRRFSKSPFYGILQDIHNFYNKKVIL